MVNGGFHCCTCTTRYFCHSYLNLSQGWKVNRCLQPSKFRYTLHSTTSSENYRPIGLWSWIKLQVELAGKSNAIPTNKFLVSKNGAEAIAALSAFESHQQDPTNNPVGNSTVDGVPIDARAGCKEVLLSALQDDDDTGSKERRPLVCTAAFRGSGKSTLQAFNMVWFIQRMGEGSVAIEATYNDDQANLLRGADGSSRITTLRQFEHSVALRIAHRLLEQFFAREDALLMAKGSELTREICAMKNPIPDALNAVRSCYDLPVNAKVLLFVDEISKAGCTSSCDASDMLRCLAESLDTYRHELYLSVAAYGAIDIARFATNSNRKLFLQTLAPLYHRHGFVTDLIPQLPFMLHPFYDERLRRLMPYVSLPLQSGPPINPLKFYEELSQLVLRTGGHPRKMKRLFNSLNKFECDLNILNTPNGREAFVVAAWDWIQVNRKYLRDRIDDANPWPEDFRGLYDDKNEPENDQLRAAIESLAIDTTCRFKLPTEALPADTMTDQKAFPAESTAQVETLPVSTTETTVVTVRTNEAVEATLKPHKYSLRGTSLGFCSYLELHGDEIPSGTLLALMPKAIVDKISMLPISALNPCGNALRLLGAALNRYQNSACCAAREKGKALEEVVLASLLLHSRSNNVIEPKVFCAAEHCGDDFKFTASGQRLALTAGPQVEHWDHKCRHWNDIKCFPHKKSGGRRWLSVEEMRNLVIKLIEKKLPGAVFAPSEIFNYAIDLFGLFEVASETLEYVLLAIQVKDWFQGFVTDAAGQRLRADESWRRMRSEVFPNQIMEFELEPGRIARVTVLFLLFTANEPKFELTCSSFEGAGSLITMRNYLPTAAFACESAAKLSCMFKLGPTEEA